MVQRWPGQQDGDLSPVLENSLLQKQRPARRVRTEKVLLKPQIMFNGEKDVSPKVIASPWTWPPASVLIQNQLFSHPDIATPALRGGSFPLSFALGRLLRSLLGFRFSSEWSRFPFLEG